MKAKEGGIDETTHDCQPAAHSAFKADVNVASDAAIRGGVTFLPFARREAGTPMVRTLAPHTTSEIQEGHISEDIPYVIPHPKSQDRDACIPTR